MVWVVRRIRLKVETSIMRGHKSINNDWIHERDLLAGGNLTTLTAASTSAQRVPSTLNVDYGREREKNSWCIVLFKQLVTARLVRIFFTFYSTQRFVTVHKIQSLPPILSWMNPVQSLSSCFLKIQFNLILLSTPKSCKLLFHWGFPTIALY